MDDRNYRFTVSLVAALARLGVAHAAVSPGSRNTPISMTLAAEAGIRDWSFHDERTAGFFALGIGKASGRPALAACTSGTAAANLHPAVVEARYARVPLVVVTADRPSEVWETASPQTIDQRDLFGSASLWSHDLDVPTPGDAPPGFAAALAGRLMAAALGGPGPVHLNLRFREPLVHTGPLPGPDGPVPAIDLGRAAPGAGTVASLAADLGGLRGLIVAGAHHDPGVAAAVAAAAGALGFPVLADPQTGLRGGRPGDGPVLAAGAALCEAGALDRFTPEVVLRVGPPPTAKPQWHWLAAHPEVPQVLVDDGGWRDPGATARRVVHAHPAAVLEALAAAGPRPAPPEWGAAWRAADRAAGEAIDAVLAEQVFPTEPLVARVVTGALPRGALLYAGSSMPIRDLDLVPSPSGRPLRVAANRGANGIDGLISSAMGAAAVWEGPVVVLSGDLSVLHDLTALAAAARTGAPVTVVVVDNDGGGIFHFLPQAGFPEVFERHFGTPHGLDLAAVAAALGVPAERITDAGALAAAVAAPPEGPRMVVVPTDRTANVAHHRAITAAVAAALEASP